MSNINENNAMQKMPRTHADRAIRAVVLVIGTLMAEAIIAAGACDLTQSLLDLISRHWLTNTKVAVGLMIVIGAIFLAGDLAVAAWLIARAARRNGVNSILKRKPKAAGETFSDVPAARPDSGIFRSSLGV